MSIIVRYITKEIGLVFAGVLGILSLILLSNRFASFLAKAATGELPLGLVFEMVFLYSPELLSYLIPVSLYVAILISFSRLHTTHEMTVLRACGISTLQFMRLILKLALIVALVNGLLTCYWVPKAAERREKILADRQILGIMQLIVPQRFQSALNERLIFYVEEVPKGGSSKGVFIAEHPLSERTESDQWVLITAQSAEIKVEPSEELEQEGPYIVLNNGFRYQGLPGRADYRVIAFEEYGRDLGLSKSSAEASDPWRMTGSQALLKFKDPQASAEWQWRLSLPLSVIVLALMAIPLSRVSPRQGRFARLIPAIILYILYYNLFTVCRRWVASGVLPAFVGSWWVHALFLIVALGFIVHDRQYLKE